MRAVTRGAEHYANSTHSSYSNSLIPIKTLCSQRGFTLPSLPHQFTTRLRGCGHRLRGCGYGAVGGRYESMADFAWQLDINNKLADTKAPRLVNNSVVTRVDDSTYMQVDTLSHCAAFVS